MTFVPTAYALNAKKGYRDGDADTTYVSHTLTSEGHDASEDGTGRGTPLVAAPLTKGSATGDGVNQPGRRQEDDVNIVAFHPTGGGAKGMSIGELAPGIGFGNGGQPAVTFTMRGREGESQPEAQTDGLHPALRSGRGGGRRDSGVAGPGIGVRLLTPVECERLQGLPDGWTLLDEKTPDSRRYSALGDAVTANVAEWIGRRLVEAA